MPTRRAFFGIGLAFAGGGLLGGAGGFSVARGRVASAGDPTTGDGEEPPPDPDAWDIRELHDFIRTATLDELIEKRLVIAIYLDRGHPRDPIVWHTLERIVDVASVNPDFPDRRLFAKLMLQEIDGHRPSAELFSPGRIETLKVLAKARR